MAGAAQKARDADETVLAASLDEAAAAVRSGIGGLRSLLVEVYPATLAQTGLAAALSDLATTLAPRAVQVRLDVDQRAVDRLDVDQAQQVFHVAQEVVRNAAKHAAATTVDLTLATRDGLVVLEITDDGVGFDPRAALEDPVHGHLGLQLLRDAAQRGGAGLAVRSAHGEGTTWRLEVPVR